MTPSDDVPSIADGEWHRLDPRSKTVRRIAGGIFVAIIAGGTLIALVLVGLFGPFGPTVGLLLLLAWVASIASLTWLLMGFPLLRYRHTLYSVSERGLCIRRGVLWRSVHFVPRNRIQHTDVSQGPIERMFELATLILYTAGTEHASVSLSGLQHGKAFEIRDHLIAAGSDDAV